MKRSEMVTRIKHHVLEEQQFCGHLDEKSAQDRADKILEMVERLGMLPPMRPIPKYEYQAPYDWESEDAQN